MTDCNSFGGVVPPLGQSDTPRAVRHRAIVGRKVVSRGATIPRVACSPAGGGEKSKTKFPVEPQQEWCHESSHTARVVRAR